MTRPPPDERPTAQELAAQSGSGSHCPKCGRVLITYKTIRTTTNIIRYRQCQNGRCERRYMTSQEPQKMIREVMPDDDNSNIGKPALTVVRNSA